MERGYSKYYMSGEREKIKYLENSNSSLAGKSWQLKKVGPRRAGEGRKDMPDHRGPHQL